MLLTMHDGRTRLSRDVEREVRQHFPALVFDTVIPRNVRVGEAPSFGRPVTHHDPHCPGRRRVLRVRQGSRAGGGRGDMSPPARGMGRGLAEILRGLRCAGDEGDDLRQVPVDLIAPNPKQPRRSFDEDALLALAGSLRERGVLQPVLVRPVAGGTYELVAGERRWRAARLAGLEEIPALVRDRDDAEALEAALIENMAREDLNPVEEARACAALVEELGLTREAVGLRVGRSRVAVTNLMRLLDLPDDVLELLERGDLTEGHGRALLLAARSRRPPPPGPLRRRRRAGRCARSRRAPATPSAGRRPPRTAAPGARRTPTSRPRPRRSPTRSAGRSASRSPSSRTATATAPS